MFHGTTQVQGTAANEDGEGFLTRVKETRFGTEESADYHTASQQLGEAHTASSDVDGYLAVVGVLHGAVQQGHVEDEGEGDFSILSC